jgi:hypothetical protein
VEGMTLCREVLVAGRAAGITDEHDWTVAYKAPSPGINSGRVYGNPGKPETRGSTESRKAAPERPVNDRLTGSQGSLVRGRDLGVSSAVVTSFAGSNSNQGGPCDVLEER